jgi:hypothetical protein
VENELVGFGVFVVLPTGWFADGRRPAERAEPLVERIPAGRAG